TPTVRTSSTPSKSCSTSSITSGTSASLLTFASSGAPFARWSVGADGRRSGGSSAVQLEASRTTPVARHGRLEETYGGRIGREGRAWATYVEQCAGGLGGDGWR